MTEWNVYGAAALLGIFALLLSATALYQHRKVKKIMKRLNQMLDLAVDGSFTEHAFDESLLSSVESRMNHFLNASAVSSRNLAAEKEKIEALLADISHQTKTPISNILLYAQLLEEQTLPEESSSCIAALNGQAEKLRFLITSLVKLSRLETGVLTMHPVQSGIDTLLTRCGEQISASAAEKDILLTVVPPDPGASACFDPKWTAEAICNLLDNAVKYTPPGGSIRLSALSYEFFSRIDVSDSGIGISEMEQAKIFTRFYRSPSVCEQDGVGIGLYLARQIITGQGGYMKVTSEIGHGAVFSVFLPWTAK